MSVFFFLFLTAACSVSWHILFATIFAKISKFFVNGNNRQTFFEDLLPCWRTRSEKVLIDYFAVPKILSTFALIRLYAKSDREHPGNWLQAIC